MHITLRLKNDNYLDVLLDLSERMLIFLSPIPNITKDELMKIADAYHFKIALPISEELIEPDELKLNETEIKEYTLDTDSAIASLLIFANTIISEY